MDGYAAATVSCIKLKGTIKACNALQILFSIFGMMLVCFATFFGGGIDSVTTMMLLAFEEICAIPLILIFAFRHY